MINYSFHTSNSYLITLHTQIITMMNVLFIIPIIIFCFGQSAAACYSISCWLQPPELTTYDLICILINNICGSIKSMVVKLVVYYILETVFTIAVVVATIYTYVYIKKNYEYTGRPTKKAASPADTKVSAESASPSNFLFTIPCNLKNVTQIQIHLHAI